jgi:serine phosphatase RsbU (regulator of sigma subunit)
VAAVRTASPRSAQIAHAGRAERRSPRRGRTSPLVSTITRVVDVVPAPVRILIGVLFALTLALALRSRVAALRNRRLERQRGELLEDVGLLQAALLPVAPARLGPVGTSAAYRPADGPGAGGDFYDVFALEDGRVAIIVGDVSGHGRQALPHTALVRFTLRAYLEAGLSPRVAVQTAGAVLERQLGESFATVVAATYHPRERTLVYACAGHPPPLVIGSGGELGEPQAGEPGSSSKARAIAPITLCASPPIGVGMRTGTRQTTVSVPGQSLICFHTDGVADARVGSELFGAERLEHMLAELPRGATALALLDRVAAATDARPDDMAACLLEVSGPAQLGGRSIHGAAPAVLLEELEVDRQGVASGRTEQFLLTCGVERRELARLVSSALATMGQAGTATLQLHLVDGPPRVTLRRENVARLHISPAVPRAVLGASQ